MIKKQSKSLVVDASVARAAGDPPNNPCSEICRDCLVQIRDSKHNICMTPEIQKEWDDHASRFSRKWQANMIAKKQFSYQSLSADSSLRKIIEESVLIFYTDLSDEAIFNNQKSSAPRGGVWKSFARKPLVSIASLYFSPQGAGNYTHTRLKTLFLKIVA